MKINDISLQLAWENSRHFATPPLQTRTQSLFKCFLGWEKIGIRLRRARGLMGRDVCLHLIPKNHLNSDWVRVCHRWFLREMTCEEQTQKFHTDDVLLPRSEWCFSLIKGNFHPIRSTTRIWAVIRHQHGISALVSQTSFRGKPEVVSKNVGSFVRLPFSECISISTCKIVEESVADHKLKI